MHKRRTCYLVATKRNEDGNAQLLQHCKAIDNGCSGDELLAQTSISWQRALLLASTINVVMAALEKTEQKWFTW